MSLNNNIKGLQDIHSSLENKVAGGYDRGYVDGVEDGKQAEYDAFWDSLQDNGNRTNYYCGFAGWTEECFKPKYDINASESYMMFRGCKIEDLGECLRAAGVKVYIKGTSNPLYAFTHSQTLKIIDEIYFTTPLSSTAAMFSWCQKLEEIRQPLLVDENTKHSNGFESLYGLKEVRFNGTIGQNGLNLQWSTKLSKASITSVINCLSTTTSGLSVTLSKTAVNKAFETNEGANDGSTSDEWLALIGTKSNWTISLG